MQVPLGRYRHYKGKEYRVIGTAIHSETKEYQVIYKPLYKIPEGKMLFSRPLKSFQENITLNNKTQPRFRQLSLTVHDAVYGTQEITDPVALEIINTPEMQRLKGVLQNGTWHLTKPDLQTSRFDHCVGVYLLLQKLGATREEQIAGLIHDIAHTAFSHVIDYVFNQETSQTIHEDFHHKIIFASRIPDILEKYGLDVKRIADEKNFPLLEQDRPLLCADRVDYFFRDGLAFGYLTKEKVIFMLASLTTHNNQIVLNNSQAAKEMAQGFLDLCNVFWANSWQSGSFKFLAEIIKQGLQKNIITQQDFFLTDLQLLQKLEQDTELKQKIAFIKDDTIFESSPLDYTYHTTAKTRYVNPPILQQGTLQNTFNLFPELKTQLEQLKKRHKIGFYVKVKC